MIFYGKHFWVTGVMLDDIDNWHMRDMEWALVKDVCSIIFPGSDSFS